MTKNSGLSHFLLVLSEVYCLWFLNDREFRDWGGRYDEKEAPKRCGQLF